MRSNLADGTAEDIQRFVSAVTKLAIDHELANVKTHMSGEHLCNEYASSFRGFHKSMATGIYNKVRNTVRTWGRP